MGRDRYQEGSIVLVGKRVKKWRGHFYVYGKQADGSEIRRHRNVLLGFKAGMDKGQAKSRLREIITRETTDAPPPAIEVSLRWFYENRYLPQKEEQWKVTSRPKTKRFIEHYLLKRFGDASLSDLDKFTLQTYLNEMAPNYSKSVLSKVRVYLNSILDEAVELEMLPKNPAGKLAVPRSGKRAATKHLTPEQISLILFHLSERDRLIVRMFLILGLRPGEMFALRWNDKRGNSLRIDSSITEGVEVETKTERSDSAVWLPSSIEYLGRKKMLASESGFAGAGSADQCHQRQFRDLDGPHWPPPAGKENMAICDGAPCCSSTGPIGSNRTS
jgi:integrase